MTQVIVLNADMSFLNVISWKRAFALISKEKVKVIKYSKEVIKNAAGEVMKIPAVIRLIKFIRTIFKTKVPFSKKNVMIRDGYKCTYCQHDGSNGIPLTIDHVVPKSKGGKSTFENCVTACKKCNSKKGYRLCSEAKMYPKTSLVAPTISEFLRRKMQLLGIDNILQEVYEGMM